MTRIYLVLEETGEYDSYSKEGVAAFSSLEAAERYAADSNAKPSFPSESGGGRYSVETLPIWEDAPFLVIRWQKWVLMSRKQGLLGHNLDPPYRIAEYYPVGWTQDLHSTIETRFSDNPNKETNDEWADIHVRSTSMESCISEVNRLVQQFLTQKPGCPQL